MPPKVPQCKMNMPMCSRKPNHKLKRIRHVLEATTHFPGGHATMNRNSCKQSCITTMNSEWGSIPVDGTSLERQAALASSSPHLYHSLQNAHIITIHRLRRGAGKSSSGRAPAAKKFPEILTAGRTHPHTRTGSSDDAAGVEVVDVVGYGDALRLALRLSRSVALIWSSFPRSTRCSSWCRLVASRRHGDVGGVASPPITSLPEAEEDEGCWAPAATPPSVPPLSLAGAEGAVGDRADALVGVRGPRQPWLAPRRSRRMCRMVATWRRGRPSPSCSSGPRVPEKLPE